MNFLYIRLNDIQNYCNKGLDKDRSIKMLPLIKLVTKDAKSIKVDHAEKQYICWKKLLKRFIRKLILLCLLVGV